jgi:diguanylate cyclase (GGDEF)-like protein
VDQQSPRPWLSARLPAEFIGSLAVLVVSLLFGLALLYVVALAHRSEQRGALADFAAMLANDEASEAVPSNTKLAYHFLDAASDLVPAEGHLAPDDDCVQFLSAKIHELHPDFDVASAQGTIRHFCEDGGTHGKIEPLGELNVVLALRPVHLENGTGVDIVSFAVAPVPSPLIVRQYPVLLALVILVSLVGAGVAFCWIRANRRQLRELARRAAIDDLTGALRRESFKENLDLAIKQTRTTLTPLCIAVLDLDRLKPINDRHGHGAGDETLRSLVNVARAHLRSADVIGRLGGDEFAVLMAGATRTAASAIAENIRNAFARASALSATVSIGVAELAPGDTADQILRRADERLYAAKATRNAVAPP